MLSLLKSFKLRTRTHNEVLTRKLVILFLKSLQTYFSKFFTWKEASGKLPNMCRSQELGENMRGCSNKSSTDSYYIKECIFFVPGYF